MTSALDHAQLLDALGDAIVVCDGAGAITFWNGAAERMFGFTKKEALGASLDIIIVAAIGTLSLTVLGDNIGPLLLMAGAGMAWSIGAFLLLAPRMVRDYPYQRGLADFGQSTGMTVTGLLLVRMADPANRANAMESFGYKQLLFEPFVGGGLFTALSVPLIAQLGPWPVLGITSALLAVSLALGLLYFGRRASER